MRNGGEADYILLITLTDKDVGAAIRSDTGEATSSELNITYHIAVEDTTGKLVYNRRLSRTQNFSTRQNIQTYRKNELDAFDNLTTEIFTAFKHGFESY